MLIETCYLPALVSSRRLRARWQAKLVSPQKYCQKELALEKNIGKYFSNWTPKHFNVLFTGAVNSGLVEDSGTGREESALKTSSLLKELRKSFKIRPSFVKKITKKEHVCKTTRGLKAALKETVTDFFRRADNSVELPMKKKVYKSGESRSILRFSCKDLHQKFIGEYNMPIGLSTFKRLRPRHVSLNTSTPLIQCVCIKCENMRLKLLALKQHSHKPYLHNIYTWNSASMCAKLQVNGRMFNDIECIRRECQNCGLENLITEVKLDFHEEVDLNTKWREWCRKTISKRACAKETKRYVCDEKETSIGELIDCIEKDSVSFSMHLFNAEWQQMAYDYNLKKPSVDELVMLSDPSENRRNEHQSQPSSLHWSYTQTSICPIVAHYQCPEKDCTETVKHVVVCLSNDLKHDAYFVEHCEETAAQSISKEANIQFKFVSKWSDGAPGSYKSRFSYYLASKDTRIRRNIFGAQHGKNLADGEGAVVKRVMDIAVKSGEVHIDSAEDAVAYLQHKYKSSENLHDTHKSRAVLFIENIPRPTYPALKPIPRIMETHTMLSTDRGQISVRDRTCLCPVGLGCRQEGMERKCPYEKFVGTFRPHALLHLRNCILCNSKWLKVGY